MPFRSLPMIASSLDETMAARRRAFALRLQAVSQILRDHQHAEDPAVRRARRQQRQRDRHAGSSRDDRSAPPCRAWWRWWAMSVC